MSYPGGKGGDGTYQRIINEIPPHLFYVEGFAGGHSVYKHKKKAFKNYLFDKDRSVFDTLGVVRCEEGYSVFCEGDFFKEAVNKYKKYLFKSSKCFCYLDPPYPFECRKDKSKLYKFEFTDEDHRRLIKLIKEFSCMVAISTYENSIYKELEVSGWRLVRFMSQTRQGPREEFLYMNYPAPTRLHDYSFLGADYIERQRIKRHIAGKIKTFEKMPELERFAVLQSLNEKFKI